jgi:hypothetical protein
MHSSVRNLMKTTILAGYAATTIAFSIPAAHGQQNIDTTAKSERLAPIARENQCVSQAVTEHVQISQGLLAQQYAAMRAGTGFAATAVAMRREKERYCFAAAQCLKLPEPQNSLYFEDCLVKKAS